jgi:hypothetical protein
LATQTAILQKSGGGLQIENNWMLGGHYGYLMQKVSPTNFADLMIVGNDIENMLTAGILFQNASGAGQLGGVFILDNEFGQEPLGIVANDPSGFLVNVSILGNDFNTLPTNGIAVTLDFVTNAFIANNRFTASGSNTGGISTGTSMTRCHIGINHYGGVTVPVTAGTPSQTVTDLTQQTGNGLATCSSAYGSFFIGTTHVNFPAGFHAAPAAFDARPTNTGVGALPGAIISNVTALGMDVSIVSTINNAAVTFSWDASGIAI